MHIIITIILLLYICLSSSGGYQHRGMDDGKILIHGDTTNLLHRQYNCELIAGIRSFYWPLQTKLTQQGTSMYCIAPCYKQCLFFVHDSIINECVLNKQNRFCSSFQNIFQFQFSLGTDIFHPYYSNQFSLERTKHSNRFMYLVDDAPNSWLIGNKHTGDLSQITDVDN